MADVWGTPTSSKPNTILNSQKKPKKLKKRELRVSPFYPLVLFPCCFLFYISHTSEIMCSCSFPSDLSHLARYSEYNILNYEMQKGSELLLKLQFCDAFRKVLCEKNGHSV